VVAPAQATWVDDIANALDSYFKAHYPASDFTSALKKLTLVRDAEDRGDRRTVEVGVRTEITETFFVSINSDTWLALSAA